MCAGKRASLGICVWGNNKLGETRIPATLVIRKSLSLKISVFVNGFL